MKNAKCNFNSQYKYLSEELNQHIMINTQLQLE